MNYLNIFIIIFIISILIFLLFIYINKFYTCSHTKAKIQRLLKEHTRENTAFEFFSSMTPTSTPPTDVFKYCNDICEECPRCIGNCNNKNQRLDTLNMYGRLNAWPLKWKKHTSIPADMIDLKNNGILWNPDNSAFDRLIIELKKEIPDPKGEADIFYIPLTTWNNTINNCSTSANTDECGIKNIIPKSYIKLPGEDVWFSPHDTDYEGLDNIYVMSEINYELRSVWPPASLTATPASLTGAPASLTGTPAV